MSRFNSWRIFALTLAGFAWTCGYSYTNTGHDQSAMDRVSQLSMGGVVYDKRGLKVTPEVFAKGSFPTSPAMTTENAEKPVNLYDPNWRPL